MDYFLKSIEDKVKNLSLKQQVLFAVLTCEKLLPNYIQFSNQEKWGSVEVLEEAIVMLYQYLQDIELNDAELDSIYEKIYDVSPHTEDFKGILTPFALDACSAIAESVEFLLSEDLSYLMNVVSIARDTVDMFVLESGEFEVSDEALETKIENNAFMQKEKKRQHDILDKLAGAEIDLPFISAIRELNNSSGEIIDLALIK